MPTGKRIRHQTFLSINHQNNKSPNNCHPLSLIVLCQIHLFPRGCTPGTTIQQSLVGQFEEGGSCTCLLPIIYYLLSKGKHSHCRIKDSIRSLSILVPSRPPPSLSSLYQSIEFRHPRASQSIPIRAKKRHTAEKVRNDRRICANSDHHRLPGPNYLGWHERQISECL